MGDAHESGVKGLGPAGDKKLGASQGTQNQGTGRDPQGWVGVRGDGRSKQQGTSPFIRQGHGEES